jgi:hypothetical protein
LPLTTAVFLDKDYIIAKAVLSMLALQCNKSHCNCDICFCPGHQMLFVQVERIAAEIAKEMEVVYSFVCGC